jgi:hypothetical protein
MAACNVVNPSSINHKWGKRFFKTGAAVLVLLGLVHSLSLFQEPIPANDTEKQLMGLMANYKFNLMGSARSMTELLRGLSASFTLAALGLGALDLLLSGERAALLKRVALVNTIWLAVMSTVSLLIFLQCQRHFSGLLC